MLYVYSVHIYVIICNSNVDYTILYDKEKKIEKYSCIFIFYKYSMCLIKLISNYNNGYIRITY